MTIVLNAEVDQCLIYRTESSKSRFLLGHVHSSFSSSAPPSLYLSALFLVSALARLGPRVVWNMATARFSGPARAGGIDS